MTDHMVVRGHYSALTIVVYGNVASDISRGIDLRSTLSELASPSHKTCNTEDMPEASQTGLAQLSMPSQPLQSLLLIPSMAKEVQAIRQLLQFAVAGDQLTVDGKWIRKVVKTLLSASSSVFPPDSKLHGPVTLNRWSSFTKLSEGELCDLQSYSNGVADVHETFQQLQDQLREQAYMFRKSDLQELNSEHAPLRPIFPEEDAGPNSSSEAMADQEDNPVLISDQDGDFGLESGLLDHAKLQTDQEVQNIAVQGDEDDSAELENDNGSEQQLDMEVGDNVDLEAERKELSDVQMKVIESPEVEMEHTEEVDSVVEKSELLNDVNPEVQIERASVQSEHTEQVDSDRHAGEQQYQDARIQDLADVEDVKLASMVRLIVSWIHAGAEEAKSTADGSTLVLLVFLYFKSSGV